MVLGAHHTASDFLQFFSELGYLTEDTGICGSCVCDNSTMEFLASADASSQLEELNRVCAVCNGLIALCAHLARFL